MFIKIIPFTQKQCQIAVLPLGTGNDLARVLGWGSSCDDDAHLPQLLERYEKASTKMLDRWSVMVFEKAIALRTPKMSVSQPDPVLTACIESMNWHLQSLVESSDNHVIVSSTKIVCETVNNLLARFTENFEEDEQLAMKCDILSQKLDMLLDTLRDEETGVHDDDDLLRTINEIAKRSASERPLSNLLTVPTNVDTSIEKGAYEKNEKDKLNTKERHIRDTARSCEKEALQCRANSIKRAVRNIIDHSEHIAYAAQQQPEQLTRSAIKERRLSIHNENLKSGYIK